MCVAVCVVHGTWYVTCICMHACERDQGVPGGDLTYLAWSLMVGKKN